MLSIARIVFFTRMPTFTTTYISPDRQRHTVEITYHGHECAIETVIDTATGEDLMEELTATDLSLLTTECYYHHLDQEGERRGWRRW